MEGCAEGTEGKEWPKMQNYAKCLSGTGLRCLKVLGERCVDGCSFWALQRIQGSLRFLDEEGGGKAGGGFPPV